MRLATLSTWRGYPLWKCKLCGFTATTKERMDRHIRMGGTGHNIKVEYEIPDVEAEAPAAEPEAKPTAGKKQAADPPKES
jgi:hypothetical protein